MLIAQKDTPSIWVWIIRFTALPPPPPTPMTLMMQGDPRSGDRDGDEGGIMPDEGGISE